MGISMNSFNMSPELLVVYSTIIRKHLVLMLFVGLTDKCCDNVLNLW